MTSGYDAGAIRSCEIVPRVPSSPAPKQVHVLPVTGAHCVARGCHANVDAASAHCCMSVQSGEALRSRRLAPGLPHVFRRDCGSLGT